jgi:hypothetical protein
MRQGRRAAAFALTLALLAISPAAAVQLPGLVQLSDGLAAIDLPRPTNVKVADRPGDDGSALIVTFDLTVPEGQLAYILPQIRAAGGDWQNGAGAPLAVDTLGTIGGMPEIFGQWARSKESKVIVIDSLVAPPPPAPLVATDPEAGAEVTEGTAAETAIADTAEAAAEGAADAAEEPESQALVAGTEYEVQLVVSGAPGSTLTIPAGTAAPRENFFAWPRLNILVISLLFTVIVLAATVLARANPNKLFIRRIAGLEAVEEAIGRATEMGKPVMQINGLDPLTTPSTIAAVNILGQIARKVAHYDSRLMVPSYDPVVMTVSQETVRQAYLEEGRPDSYREEDIFFVTDQQFSYVASVCGLMLREKPAAIFFLGYFYAESLLLAETGQSTGAIQIAGTDSQSQLPFFITTCDYTLIGEEIYAASAYLSREPVLLGGLKGIDLSKVIIMLLILFGSVLATFGQDWLTRVFTPLG